MMPTFFMMTMLNSMWMGGVVNDFGMGDAGGGDTGGDGGGGDSGGDGGGTRAAATLVAATGGGTSAETVAGSSVATVEASATSAASTSRRSTVDAARHAAISNLRRQRCRPGEPPRGLGDRAAHRRVDRERLGQLVGGQRLGHRDRHRVDQLGGPGRDDDPARRCAGAGPAEQLHEAVRTPCILARALPASGSMTASACDLARVDGLLRPADGGDLGRGEDVGGDLLAGPAACTASPRKCHIAIRPCIAATEASISTPVQSPAAYTPRAEVRETRSTVMKPPSSRPTPASSRPRPAVLGTEPRARMQCEPVDGAAVGQRDGDGVAVAGHRLHPRLATARSCRAG